MRVFVILGAVAMLLIGAPAAAEPAAPPPPRNITDVVVGARLFVERLYAVYVTDDVPDLFGKPDQTFEPELAAAIATLAKRMEQGGEMPASFGADPACNCQDYGDVSFRIDYVGLMGQRASARVSFSNFGAVDTRRIDLVITPQGWRVFDIDGTFRSSVMADLAAPQP